ncbi:hypothetical protein B7463_g5203, partial [Scytalidium lignicola]
MQAYRPIRVGTYQVRDSVSTQPTDEIINTGIAQYLGKQVSVYRTNLSIQNTILIVIMPAFSGQSSDPEIPWPPKHSPASAVVFAHNSIDIEASPEKVWSLLIDCVAWPRWYKKCSDVSLLRGGPQLEAGSKFRFKTLRNYFEPEILRLMRTECLFGQPRGR